MYNVEKHSYRNYWTRLKDNHGGNIIIQRNNRQDATIN